MIVRRGQRRRNYTICPNEIFDAGLKPDAIGILAYLISRPDDWNVSLRMLSKHRQIGRDKTQRIINDLIDAGYVKRKRVRDPETNQFVGIEYVVYEDRQPLDKTDVNSAKSSGIPPESENPVAALPQPEKPRAENPAEIIRTDLTNLSPKKGVFQKSDTEPSAVTSMALEKKKGELPVKSAMPFETFEDAWQWKPNDDRTGARQAFDKLTHSDRRSALIGIPAFQASVESGNCRLVQAKRYLRHQRWKNPPSIATAAPATDTGKVFVTDDDPLWRPLKEAYKLKTGQPLNGTYWKRGVGNGWDFDQKLVEQMKCALNSKAKSAAA